MFARLSPHLTWKRIIFLASCLLVFSSLFAVEIQAQDATQNVIEDDVISFETNLVVLNLTVSDAGGSFVRKLKKSDFLIREDNQPQQILNFLVETTPFAAVILIDFSGSMEGRTSLARAAAIHFLAGLRAEDTASVYRFDSEIKMMQEFSSSRDLAPVAYGRQAKGMTKLHDAIVEAAAALAARPEKRRAIIVLSDGADTQSRHSADKALAVSLAAGATLYTVDMADNKGGLPSAAGSLRNFAVKSGGRFISTPGGRETREALGDIVEELSNQYTITYRPTNTAHDGKWREIEVSTTKPEIRIRTRRGYRAPSNKR